MADAALILTQGNNLPPSVNPQGAPSGVVQGIVSDSAGSEGRFSTVLSNHMQSQEGQPKPTTEKPGPVTGINQTDDPLPQDGKALPSQPLQEGAATANTAILEEATGFSVSPLMPEISSLMPGNSPLIPEMLLSELFVGEQADQNPLGENQLAVLNGLTPTALLKSEAPPGSHRQQLADNPRQQPMQLAQLAMQQNSPATNVLSNTGLPVQQQSGSSDALLDEHIQPPVLVARPLTGNERLMLERVKASASPSVQGTSELAEKGLSRDMLSLAGLETRRAILAATQVGTQTTQHDFKPVLEQYSSPLTSVIHQGEESTYSSVLNSVQGGSSTLSSQTLPVLNVATPVGQRGWSNEMGQRVTWMASTEVREAQLQLHPRHLGPMEVRISFGQDQQMNVNFTVTNPLAREAVDAALPRLREMFEQQGMNLQDANVSQESYAEQQQRRRHGETFREDDSIGGEDHLDMEMTLDSPPLMHGISEGMIDAYA